MFTLPRAIALLAIIALPACSNLVAGGDHTRDFAVAHPIVTAVAVTALGARVYALARHDHHNQGLIRRPVQHCTVADHPDLCN
jgi:hypothetical protein